MVSLSYRISSRARKSLSWLRGWFFAWIILPFHKALRLPIWDLSLFQRRIAFIERKEFSQNGEDGIIHAIFAMIGTTNKYFVEFGVEDGIECNTHYLSTYKGWKGLLMDGSNENPYLNLHKEFITAENIEELFKKYDVPSEPDLLSIDIDGNDYWIWKAITQYKPRVVIMEYNACFPWNESKTIPYKSDFQWDKTDYYGATLQAMVKLGNEKGYTLVATDRNGVNAFFVRNDALRGIHVREPERLYHPASFKGKVGNVHPRDPQNRPWVAI